MRRRAEHKDHVWTGLSGLAVDCLIRLDKRLSGDSARTLSLLLHDISHDIASSSVLARGSFALPRSNDEFLCRLLAVLSLGYRPIDESLSTKENDLLFQGIMNLLRHLYGSIIPRVDQRNKLVDFKRIKRIIPHRTGRLGCQALAPEFR